MIRTFALFLIASLFLSQSAYAISPEEAQEWLKGKKIPYTADEFVLRAGQGDAAVVNLFLDSGMDPDAKDKNGRTAMQVAIEKNRGNIIEILIEKGADRVPLISALGDKDTLLKNMKSLGYITVGEEYYSGKEHIATMADEDLPADMAEAFSLIERKGTAGSVTLMSPDVYKEMKVEQEGGFGGLGIVIGLDKNHVLSVIEPIQDTPASRAGIKAGDKIMKIDGESAEGITLDEAVKRLRGSKDSRVNITVKRHHADDNEEETLNLTLVRDRIKIPSIKQEMLDNDIGYIRIEEFSRETANDFRKSISKIRAEGMRYLVLDLRNNPGGSLQVAIDIADEFLEKDRLICVTFSSYEDLNMEFKAKREKSLRFETPVVVLVNGGTVGASEVVAAALRDSGVGILLGKKTPGMGTVQNTIPLADGSALNLTTAGLLTANREAIDGIGLTPNIAVNRTFVCSEESPYDSQQRCAIEFLKEYDLSKTTEQNISDMKERIKSNPDKYKDERILWDQLERMQIDEMLKQQLHIFEGIPEEFEEIQEKNKDDSNK